MALGSPRFRDNARLQAAASNNPALKFGSEGEHVQILQRALIDLGFAMPDSAPEAAILPDGIFGGETARTVKQFQAQEGLTPDGIAGRQTLERLDKIFLAASAREEIVLSLQASRMFWT